MGGTLAAIERGYQQRQIQESAYRVQRRIESRRPGRRRGQPVPGRRRARPPAIQRIDPEGERRQVEGVRRVRAERDPVAWAAALDRLEPTPPPATPTSCRR